ncbi:nuclease-related domain-containing protein [Solibacillus cecembensis]|uniref:nuclease-related domain-containing protein n=1 Tax=Solibacillus cecembensis TaxID=459347 RepID=UPI003CFCE899
MDMFYIVLIAILFLVILYFIFKFKRDTKKYEELINSSNNELASTLYTAEEKYSKELQLTKGEYNEKLQIEGKKIQDYYNQKIQEIKNTVSIKYKKDFQKIKEEHDGKLNKIEDYIKNFEKYSRNRGEIITHKILVDLKSELVKNQEIQPEDMIIMGNVFIPFITKDKELMTRQIDHLILCQSGIYVIETKFWKGKILHGISKKNAGDMSIVFNNIFYDNPEDKEETIIFEPLKKNDDNIREFKVVSYDNPVKQVRGTAGKLNEYINLKLNINKGVSSIVYFGYPIDTKNFVENYSSKTSKYDKYAALICINSKDLRTNVINLVSGNEKKFNMDELKKIEVLLNEFNRII